VVNVARRTAAPAWRADIRLRPSQEAILSYAGGKMGISAVPGAGKTFTLSLLAADLLLRGVLRPDQEILIVTLVNSAVDNFAARIGSFLSQANILPGMGYRVRTLHGLANDIVRERPEAVGLPNDFQIIDEYEGGEILRQVAHAWLRSNPLLVESYLREDIDEMKAAQLRQRDLPPLVESAAVAAIRWAKDKGLTPEALRAQLDLLPLPLPLAEMGCALYADYQRAINYRGAVDFDDLIRLAELALRNDATLVERLNAQWPYVLEDEAQDSSRLQEEILTRLTGPRGNWVRVGDPNQAIYETFTTANPAYLQDFRRRRDVVGRDLPESGRSQPAILDLANRLIEWSQQSAPEALRKALADPYIQVTPSGDPQPNPAANPRQIFLHPDALEPAREIQLVAASIENYLREAPNREKTIAVLVPRNIRGNEMVDELKRKNIDVVDSLLKTSAATRASAGALTDLLVWLTDPKSANKLSAAYKAWRRGELRIPESKPLIVRAAGLLQSLQKVEDYLSPLPDRDWLEGSGLEQSAPQVFLELASFREVAINWQKAVLLPVDQLVLTLAQDLFPASPPDLAVAHKMAGVLRQRADAHPAWQLPELTGEIAAVARNERRFLGFSPEDTRFDPDNYKGQVVVATIHKAKGLEWDRVYLLSANNYDFPSGDVYDRYISEKWFIRGAPGLNGGSLNIEAEMLDQLQLVTRRGEYEWYEESAPTLAARKDYVRERLRLFFVGVTRARRELVITWNTGRDGKLVRCRALEELIRFKGA
jgi:DNA helicase II / ATP-dependent DNA helicase PcrA